MNLDPQIVSGVANVVTNLPTSVPRLLGGRHQQRLPGQRVQRRGVNSSPSSAGTLSNTSAAVGFIIIRLPSGQLKMITTWPTAQPDAARRSESRNAGHRVGWRRVKGE
jgi:type IV pilus assembly protein PilY1